MHVFVPIDIHIKIGCYIIHLCYKSVFQLASAYKIFFIAVTLIHFLYTIMRKVLIILQNK